MRFCVIRGLVMAPEKQIATSLVKPLSMNDIDVENDAELDAMTAW